MSAGESLSPYQFKAVPLTPKGAEALQTFGTPPTHVVYAHHGNDMVGHMRWHHESGEVTEALVQPEHQRRGVATGMWNHAHKVAEAQSLVSPTVGPDRTHAGDAFVHSLGVPVPPRKAVNYLGQA